MVKQFLQVKHTKYLFLFLQKTWLLNPNIKYNKTIIIEMIKIIVYIINFTTGKIVFTILNLFIFIITLIDILISIIIVYRIN